MIIASIRFIIQKIFYLFYKINCYKIVALIGLFVRLYILPHPLELLNTYWNLPECLWKLVLFLLDYFFLSSFLYGISYISVGIMYVKNSKTWWGSILYTVFYCSYVLAIYLLIPEYSTIKLILIILGLIFIFVVTISISKILGTTPSQNPMIPNKKHSKNKYLKWN